MVDDDGDRISLIDLDRECSVVNFLTFILRINFGKIIMNSIPTKGYTYITLIYNREGEIGLEGKKERENKN